MLIDSGRLFLTLKEADERRREVPAAAGLYAAVAAAALAAGSAIAVAAIWITVAMEAM